MGKKPSKKRPADADFASSKQRVGKKQLGPSNATPTVFKARSVVLPEQLALAHAERAPGIATSARQLALPDLLAQLGHYSPAVRKDALFGLRDLSERNPGALAAAAARTLDGCLALLADGDAAVRTQLILLLRHAAETLGPDGLRPFAPLLLLRLTAALSHTSLAVRCDAARAALAVMPALSRAHSATVANAPGGGAGTGAAEARAPSLVTLLAPALDFVRASALGPEALSRLAREARTEGAQLLELLLCALGGGDDESGSVEGAEADISASADAATVGARPAADGLRALAAARVLSLPPLPPPDADRPIAEGVRLAQALLARAARGAELAAAPASRRAHAALADADAHGGGVGSRAGGGGVSAVQVLRVVVDSWQVAVGASTDGAAEAAAVPSPPSSRASPGASPAPARAEYLAALVGCALAACAAIDARTVDAVSGGSGASGGGGGGGGGGGVSGWLRVGADGAAGVAAGSGAGWLLGAQLAPSQGGEVSAVTHMLCVRLLLHFAADRGSAADKDERARAVLRERCWLLAARISRAAPAHAHAASAGAGSPARVRTSSAVSEQAARAAALGTLQEELCKALVAEVGSHPRASSAQQQPARQRAQHGGASPAAAGARTADGAGGGGGGGRVGGALLRAVRASLELLQLPASAVAEARASGAPAAAGARAELVAALFACAQRLAEGRCAGDDAGGGGGGGGGGASSVRSLLSGAGAHALFAACAALSVPPSLRPVAVGSGGGLAAPAPCYAHLPLASAGVAHPWLRCLPRCIWEAAGAAPQLSACALGCMRAHVLWACAARGGAHASAGGVASADARAEAAEGLARGILPFFAALPKTGDRDGARAARLLEGGAEGEPLFGPFCAATATPASAPGAAQAGGAGAAGWAAVRRAAISLVCALARPSDKLCVALGACALHVESAADADLRRSGSADTAAAQCVHALAGVCARAPPAESAAALGAIVAAALSPRAFGGAAAGAEGRCDVGMRGAGAEGHGSEAGPERQRDIAAQDAPALDAHAAAALAMGEWAATGGGRGGGEEGNSGAGSTSSPFSLPFAPQHPTSGVCRAHLAALDGGSARRCVLGQAARALRAVGDAWGRQALCAALGAHLCGQLAAAQPASPARAAQPLVPLAALDADVAPGMAAAQQGTWERACMALSQEEAIVTVCAHLAPPHLREEAALVLRGGSAGSAQAVALAQAAAWAPLSELAVPTAVRLLCAPALASRRRAGGDEAGAAAACGDEAAAPGECELLLRSAAVARLLLAAPALAPELLAALHAILRSVEAPLVRRAAAARAAHCLLRCAELQPQWEAAAAFERWGLLADAAAEAAHAEAGEAASAAGLRSACAALYERARVFRLALAAGQTCAAQI